MIPSSALQACRHFGACGGCATQDIPYAEEIRRKEATLQHLLQRDIRVRPSPREFYYRTRMDFTFAWGKIGLRKKGDPQGVLDLEECLLISPRAFESFQTVRAAIKKEKIAPYSFVSRKGYLRYVTLREAPITGQLMFVLFTNGTDPAIEPVLEAAESCAEAVVWTTSDRRADISIGDVHKIQKQGWIEEQIGDLRFRFGPNSFFQGNPYLTRELYGYVAERVSGKATDLYCGVGGIALAAAGRADSVLGLDNNSESIRYADHNVRSNFVTNTRFLVGDSRLFLDYHKCDTLILDPTRNGIGPKHIRKVVRSGVPRVIYVSCNPRALSEELPHFAGYSVREMEGFDLFPKTPHVEVVAVLDKD